jgi:hypothetical protein
MTVLVGGSGALVCWFVGLLVCLFGAADIFKTARATTFTLRPADRRGE